MNEPRAVHPLFSVDPERIIAVESFGADHQTRQIWEHITVFSAGAYAAESAKIRDLSEAEAKLEYIGLCHDAAAAAFGDDDDFLLLTVSDLQQAVYRPEVEAWLMPSGLHLQFLVKTVLKP